MPTVILGAARDIVEHVGAARFVFSDVPLGNPAGRPHDPLSQALALESAFKLLESAPGPRTTWQSPIRWQGNDHSWKADFMNPADVDAAQAKAAFEKEKERARSQR